MILLMLITLPAELGNRESSERHTRGSQLRLWSRFLDWLKEPIPFPAMTFDIEPPQKRYNRETRSGSESACGIDERRTPQS